MRRLLSDRNFRLLLAGQTLTMFGDVALFLVLGIWVKELTGSDGAAGAVFFALAVPALVAPLAGVFIDRFSRRTVMIINDLATGTLILALFAVHDRSDVWIIYAVALLYGGSQQIFFAARSGLLVTMLDNESLGDANSLLESIRQGLRIGGPLIGAAVFATLGGGAIAAIDAATFYGSAALLSIMTVPETIRDRNQIPFIEELLAGWQHIRSTPALRMVVAAISIALAVVGLLEVALFALVDKGLGRSPEFVGVIATIQGVGSIVGGVLAGPALRRLGETSLLGISLAVVGVGLGMLVVTSMAFVVVGVVLVGVGLAAHLVAYMTLIQRRTANELQGRVFSAAEAILTVPFAASMAVGVALISVLGYRLIYGVNGIALLLVGGWMYFWREPDAPAREAVPEQAA